MTFCNVSYVVCFEFFFQQDTFSSLEGWGLWMVDSMDCWKDK